MSLVIADRVQEVTTTSFAGTGAVQLDGVPTNPAGRVSFASGVGDGNETVFLIDDSAGNWEISLGSLTSGSPDALSRDTVIASSAGGAKVNFTAGVKDVKAVLSKHTLATIGQLSYGSSGGGSANAQTADLSVAPSRYEAGMRVSYKPSAANTGPATLNVNGLGAKNIKKTDAVADIEPGDLAVGRAAELIFDGTSFLLLSRTERTVLQFRTKNYTTRQTYTTVVPYDDTKFQSTEGVQIDTFEFTPKSANSRLHIEWIPCLSGNVATVQNANAVFKDSDTDPLVTGIGSIGINGALAYPQLVHDMASPGTSLITFKARGGVNGSVGYVNYSGSNFFGLGQLRSVWRITEYVE